MKKNSNWKAKLNRFFFSFHQEVIKTSVIGKKMLTASRTNAHLKDTYEELGRLVEKAMENGEVDWDSPKARALLSTIRACKKDLEEIERQVYKIKFAASPKGPQDIAKQLSPPKNSDNKSEDKKD
jgi:hypothetical protein